MDFFTDLISNRCVSHSWKINTGFITRINGRRVRSRISITRTGLFRVVGYAIVSIKQKRALSGVAPLMVTRPSFLLLLCDNPQRRR